MPAADHEAARIPHEHPDAPAPRPCIVREDPTANYRARTFRIITSQSGGPLNTFDYVSAHVQGNADPQTLILQASISHRHEVTEITRAEATNGKVLEAVQQFARRLLAEV